MGTSSCSALTVSTRRSQCCAQVASTAVAATGSGQVVGNTQSTGANWHCGRRPCAGTKLHAELDLTCMRSAQWLLQTVGAVAFRCLNATKLESQRPTCGTLADLFDALRGWSGTRQVFVPTPGVDGQLNDPQPVVFSLSLIHI